MTLDTYQMKENQQKELEIRDEHLIEVLKYYVLFSNITKLSFFEYDYEYNNYIYSFSVNEKEIFEESHTIDDSKYSVIIEEEKTIFGMITFNENPGESDVIDELFEKIKIVLRKKFLLEQNLMTQELKLEIYIISDNESLSFANKISTNLSVLLNASIRIESSVSTVVEKLIEKTHKSIIIYTVANNDLLKRDNKLLLNMNEFLVVIGPSDYNISLYCGQINVFKYLSKENYVPEQLKSIIIETKHKTQNKYINKNNIIALSGISGGIGTTTVSMNMANILAKKNPDQNVLYIDLSKTKAISNLFLEQNPLPKKTIIDLVNSAEFDLEKNLENGLVKVRENFYSINGIQKHIDRDIIVQSVFIEKFLGYISKMGEQFNFIIIDTGEADSSSLNTTIYDISNELWILTEMSLPHISKLKTFFSLMKRAGLQDKLSLLLNRYDSVNAISVSDVSSILNTTNNDHLNFDFKIPNDYEVLGHCWNYCELASDTHAKSIFIKKLEKILKSRGLFEENLLKEKETTSWLSFLK